MARSLQAAVLLAGCGHLDGAEIREAVLTLLALDQHGVSFQCVAPHVAQHHVVDHRSGQPVTGASRNVLEEASRIARVGQCLDVAVARPADYDLLVIPGGYGVAKNLCDFAFRGAEATVRPEVASFVQAFFEAGKPVGAICISPALVALVLSRMGQQATLTLGTGEGVADAMARLGHTHQATSSAREVVVDENLRLVTTGAYMFDGARLSDLWVGIERCVAECVRRVR